MKKSMDEFFETRKRSNRLRKVYYSLFMMLAIIITFCTVYTLILPAITLTNYASRKARSAVMEDVNEQPEDSGVVTVDEARI